MRVPDVLFLADLAELVETTTQLGDYPQASSVEQNVLIYDGGRLRGELADPGRRQEVRDEWVRALRDGPGIVVLAGAFGDLAVVEAATREFEAIIAAQHAAGGAAGDHFAAAGQNDRIWNALEKLARQAARYPAHVHLLSPALTLQGAVAHTDMPVPTGPTMYLPHSQKYLPGYLAFRRPEFAEYFEAHHVQLPLRRGDAVFFNPALLHGAGANHTGDVYRMANLLQVSSPVLAIQAGGPWRRSTGPRCRPRCSRRCGPCARPGPRRPRSSRN